MARSGRRRDTLHRTRQLMGERLQRVLQRQAAQRASERGNLHDAEGAQILIEAWCRITTPSGRNGRHAIVGYRFCVTSRPAPLALQSLPSRNYHNEVFSILLSTIHLIEHHPSSIARSSAKLDSRVEFLILLSSLWPDNAIGNDDATRPSSFSRLRPPVRAERLRGPIQDTMLLFLIP